MRCQLKTPQTAENAAQQVQSRSCKCSVPHFIRSGYSSIHVGFQLNSRVLGESICITGITVS
jgi:hypothetical protein